MGPAMSRARPPSIIDVVEAIYSEIDAASPISWLTHVLERVHSLTVESRGGFAYAYDLSGAPSAWRISYPVICGMPEAIAAGIFDSFEASPPETRPELLPRLGASGTLSAAAGMLLSDLPVGGARAAKSLGVLDAIHVNAVDPNGRGILVALAIEVPRRLHPTERRRLAMLSAHIASARRLLVSGAATPIAVFERSGAVAHVEKRHEPAIASLQERLVRTERLKSWRSGSDADEILASWEALVSGRYSLVRRFDSDGRRYVMAYENAPNVTDPRGLSQLEAAVANLARHGHSQKLIAYELGLSVGTVGGLLARVFRKLRVRSTPELIERLATPSSVARATTEDGRELLLFTSSAVPDASVSLASLTEAERDVALRAARGASTATIARARSTSLRTVEHQLEGAFRKLGVSSRAELAARLFGGRRSTR
jgi:DNA-binding CsgD family transcriptional regulator